MCGACAGKVAGVVAQAASAAAASAMHNVRRPVGGIRNADALRVDEVRLDVRIGERISVDSDGNGCTLSAGRVADHTEARPNRPP